MLKKTIDEIVAKNVLETSIKQIYTEGVSDKNILEWFFGRKKRSDIDVYSIDMIEVPIEVVEKYSLNTRSQRDKVIALAYELDKRLKHDKKGIRCLIDLDFDKHLNKKYSCTFLAYTDYTSMQLYMFNKKIISKFFKLVLGGFSISEDELLRKMTNILQELFGVRLANERLGWGMSWLPFHRYIWLNSITLDKDKFLQAYLMKNNKCREKDILLKEIEKIEYFEDCRQNIRGKDFIELFCYIVKKKKSKKSIDNVNIFEGSLLGCLELVDIEEEQLFKDLAKI